MNARIAHAQAGRQYQFNDGQLKREYKVDLGTQLIKRSEAKNVNFKMGSSYTNLTNGAILSNKDIRTFLQDVS